jgi:HD-GYP domain-containing protein (c-di-GMP phosphodiesterase class II)
MALPVSVLASLPPAGPSGAGVTPPPFVGVDLDGLVVDSILDFNLYLTAGSGQYVFFRSPKLPFTVHHRNRLLDHDVRTVYIRADEREQYAKYLEHNIGAVLSNPEVPTRKKATLLYTVTKQAVHEAFEAPRAQTIVPRTRRLASETVDFVLRSDRALVQLASVMATDYYTYTHSINVCVFAVALAHRIGVAREDIGELAAGALLHDLGKSLIPHELITRVGPLSDEEMEVMRNHVVLGEQLLAEHGGIGPLGMHAVSLHHEKLNGAGYPRGLSGDAIHTFGRVAAIADCFDAMTTNRSYQRALAPFDALQLMRAALRDQFDQALLEQFIRMLRAPDGLMLQAS